MNDLDKAGRYLAKRDPPGFLCWLVDNPRLAFHAWIDARRLALPNQGDLANDLVAVWRIPGGFEALCIEMQAEARADTLLRELAYIARLLTEPGDPHSLPLAAAGAAVLNLTGRNPIGALVIRTDGVPACQLELRVVVRNLCDEPAADLLAGVKARAISPWQLGWAPLMQGGASPATIDQWCRLAEGLLPDPRDRADLGMLALTFAVVAGCRPMWEQKLRRWNVQTSPLWDEIRAEGREEGQADGARAVLLRLGRQKFKKPPTRKQQQELAAIRDLGRLESLAERLLTVDTWAQLLNAH